MIKNPVKIILTTVLFITSSVLFAEGFLGVLLREPTSDEYAKNKLENKGLVIEEIIDKSPAHNANLEVGDIVLKLDGEKIYTSNQLSKMLSVKEKGDEVKLVILRKNEEISKKIELGSREDVQPRSAYLGIISGTLTSIIKKDLNYNNNYGVILSTIIEDSPAYEAGLEPNDIIMKMDGEKVYTHGQLASMLKNYKPGDIVKLLVYKASQEKERKIEVELGESDLSQILSNSSSFLDADWFDNKNKKTYMFKFDSQDNNVIGVKVSYSNVNGKKSGLVIEEVIPESPAAKAGIEKDDIVISIGDMEVTSIKDFIEEIQRHNVGDKISIKVKRNDEIKDFSVEIAERNNIFKHTEDFDNFQFDVDIDDLIKDLDIKHFKFDGLKIIENLYDLNEDALL